MQVLSGQRNSQGVLIVVVTFEWGVVLPSKYKKRESNKDYKHNDLINMHKKLRFNFFWQ